MRTQTTIVGMILALTTGACGSNSAGSRGRGTETKQPDNDSTGLVPSDGDAPDHKGTEPAPCDCTEGVTCMHLHGKPVDVSGQCSESIAMTACYPYPEECVDAYHYARDPSDKLWLFPTSCIPLDWRYEWFTDPVDASCLGDPSTVDCARLGASDCMEYQDRCTTVMGRRVDEVGKCVGEAEFVACRAWGPRGCGAALTHARDASGALWMFPSTCLPPGWEREPSEAERPSDLCQH